VKIVDLISKNVLSWKLSNSLVTEFCLKALKMAQGGRRRLKTIHSDKYFRFTSSAFESKAAG
jgi:putative transposase